MKKKIIGLLAVCTIFCSATAFAHFDDMPKSKTYKNAIENLVDLNVISGYPDNTFKGENHITRAEFVKMMMTALNEDVDESSNSKFSDVENDFWATKYINKATEKGYINGYEDGTFKPSKEISYSEVSAIITRAMKKADKIKPSDMSAYMKLASELELTKGIETNDLTEISSARRDNVALMIYNMLNYEEPKKEEKPSAEEKIDTKLLRVAFVKGMVIDRGNLSFNLDDGENEYTMSYSDELSSFESFMEKNGRQDIKEPNELISCLIIYKMNLKGGIILEKIIKADEINGLVVKSADDELVAFENADTLDLSLKNYGDVKLSKCYFYLVKYSENDDETFKFESAELKDISKLGLKKEDKLLFTADNKLCLIFREV